MLAMYGVLYQCDSGYAGIRGENLNVDDVH